MIGTERINSRWYHWEKMEHNMEICSLPGHHRPPPNKQQILGMWCNREARCMPSDVRALNAKALVHSHMTLCRHICSYKTDNYNIAGPIFTLFICPQAADTTARKIIPHDVQMLSSLMLLILDRGFDEVMSECCSSSTIRPIFSLNQPDSSILHQQCSHSATPVSVSVQTKDLLMWCLSKRIFSFLFFI